MERGRDEHGIEGGSQGASSWQDLDVEVGYDPEARVYYVISSDIPGLNVETTTLDTFIEVVVDAAPDLLPDPQKRTRINFKQSVDLMPGAPIAIRGTAQHDHRRPVRL